MTKVQKKAFERPALFMWCFAIAFGVSVALFIGGFFVPPMGQIDGSVLKAGGILMGGSDLFAVVYMLPAIIASGRGAKFKHGQLEVTIGNPDSSEEE